MRLPLLRRLSPRKRRWRLAAALLPLVAGLVIAAALLPKLGPLRAVLVAGAKPVGSQRDRHDHAQEVPDAPGEAGHGGQHEAKLADGPGEPEQEGDEHGQSGASDHQHDEAAAVKLSQAAQENVGLRLAKVELSPFERTITVPAIIVERPGRTNIQVAAPLTGMITRVWPMQGEAVTPGQPLFDLRLTHEEVVEAQAEFLRTAEELDVVQREIDRLEKVAANGVVSGKTLLERKYEQQKLQAAQRSQRQRLLLHGLSPQQADDILAKRTLLNGLTIVVPEESHEAAKGASKPLLQVEELKVEKGQHVKTGDALCVVADYSELFIQGKAFEEDAPVLDKAASNGWPVTLVIDANGQGRQTVPTLPLLYVASKVEPESRAVLFYVQLPNQLIRNRRTADGHRFSEWRFKPGQRVRLLVPVERWADRIVLPVSAVVQDGPEWYVFEENDGHFDRRPVRVEYRDEDSAVIANDGSLAPGKMVIVSGAYQVHLAIKNKAAGAPDPHAGHNH